MLQALKYKTKVKVLLKAGTLVEVILIEHNGKFSDLMKSSETSINFWDNSIDDEVWNDA